jgi:HK97 family phage major capsid protein
VNTAGGFLVPEFYETSIIRIVEEFGVFRRNSYDYPMGSDVVSVPRRNAGLTVYYTAENTAITASDMSFNQVQLVAKKPSILTQISSELNEDEVVGLASLLTQEFGLALATAEDQAGFNGDGTSTFGGILGLKNALAAGSIHDAVSGTNAFSNIDLADFNKCKGKLPLYAGARNKWYISKQGFATSMELLASALGGATSVTLSEGLKPMFLGDPVEFVQVLPTADSQASTIVAYYGDLAMATTMGVRRAMRIDSDSSVYFASDSIAVRCTERFDIVCHSPGTASVCGPIVALKLAA